MSNHVDIVHIVAFDKQRAIGSNNKLAWHLPEDLKRFNTLTSNHVVIMGRKTFESIGSPLRNRVNIIVSSKKNLKLDTAIQFEQIGNALDAAYKTAIKKKQNRIYIIGGGEIYAQTLPLATIIEATEIDMRILNPDAHYPEIPSDFKAINTQAVTDAKSGIGYSFITYKKETHY